MPALPAVSTNFTPSVLFFAAKASTLSTTPARVSALWSCRYTNSDSRLQPWLKISRGVRLATVFSVHWLGTSSYHFGLPSFMPTVIRRLSNGSELVPSTPATSCNSHSSASTSA
ncbi:hypothetical protein D3C84_1035640 [compost metagenome]